VNDKLVLTSNEPGSEVPVKGRSNMWLRLLWQLREMLPLLARMLPLLEGWVAGNSGASAATSAAMQKLESRVASAVGTVGATQEDLSREMREQSQVLLQLHGELKQIRVVVERESMEREVLAEGLAQVRGWTKILLAAVIVCLLLLTAVLLLMVLHVRR